MGNIILSTHILSIEKIIKMYFPSNNKLYCLTEDEIARCGATHDVDIMYLFNNRTWLDVWNNFDFFDINHIIFGSFYSLGIPVKYYRETNNLPKISFEENNNNVRFFSTALLYMGTVAKVNDKVTPSRNCFSISGYLDPKETYGAYYGYIEPMKDFFPSLVDKYTPEQLFLLSILFVELPKYIDVSEMGQKYWTWIYENTDNDTRERIMKQFEEKS